MKRIAYLILAPLAALAAQQRESDAYTRYELLAPGSAKLDRKSVV